MLQKVETKVIAATAGGGLGAAFGQFILWLLAVLFWHASNSADAAAAAIAKVPGPVALLITLLVAAAGALIGGYKAPHTDRPDLIDQSSTPADESNVPVVTTAPVSVGAATVRVVPVNDSGEPDSTTTLTNDGNGLLPADFDFSSLVQADPA